MKRETHWGANEAERVARGARKDAVDGIAARLRRGACRAHGARAHERVRRVAALMRRLSVRHRNGRAAVCAALRRARFELAQVCRAVHSRDCDLEALAFECYAVGASRRARIAVSIHSRRAPVDRLLLGALEQFKRAWRRLADAARCGLEARALRNARPLREHCTSARAAEGPHQAELRGVRALRRVERADAAPNARLTFDVALRRLVQEDESGVVAARRVAPRALCRLTCRHAALAQLRAEILDPRECLTERRGERRRARTLALALALCSGGKAPPKMCRRASRGRRHRYTLRARTHFALGSEASFELG